MNVKFLFSKLMLKIQIPSIKNSKIDKKAKIASRSKIYNSEMKSYSYVGVNTSIVNTKVGKFCSISGNCNIGVGGHPFDFVSTSPVFYEGSNFLGVKFADIPYDEYKETIIGNDVWIGTDVMIKSGVQISTGAVIGMGSIVVKDVGPYEIWAGNPARFIKKRFSDDVIEKLIQSKWWEMPDEELKKFAPYFNKPEKLIEMLEERK